MHPSTPTPPHFGEPRWEFTKRMELTAEEHRRLKALRRGEGASLLLVAVLRRGGRAPRGDRQPALQGRLRRGDEPAAARGGRGDREARPALDRDGRDRGRRARLGDPRAGGGEVLVLQCTSTYPAPPEKVQPPRDGRDGRAPRSPLRPLRPHAGHLHLGRGGRPRRLGDREALHTLEAALRAGSPRVADPEELGRLVQGIREVEAALGSAEKERDPELDPARATFEKSVVTPRRDRRRHPDRRRDPDHEAARQRDTRAEARRALRPARPPRRRAQTRCSRRPTLPERRKVCVVVASRANYARIKTVLAAVRGPSRARAPDRRGRLARARALRERRRRDGDGRLHARRDNPLHHRGRDAGDDGEVDRARAPRAADSVRAAAAGRRRHRRGPLRDDRDGDRGRLHEHPGRAHAGR